MVILGRVDGSQIILNRYQYEIGWRESDDFVTIRDDGRPSWRLDDSKVVGGGRWKKSWFRFGDEIASISLTIRITGKANIGISILYNVSLVGFKILYRYQIRIKLEQHHGSSFGQSAQSDFLTENYSRYTVGFDCPNWNNWCLLIL